MGKRIQISFLFDSTDEKHVSFYEQFITDFTLCLRRFKLAFDVHSNKTRDVDVLIGLIYSQDFLKKDILGYLSSAEQEAAIFVIGFNSIRDKKLSDSLNKYVRVEFWDIDPETNEYRVFGKATEASSIKYWDKITDMVIAISHSVFKEQDKKRKCVYLSQTILQQQGDFDNIRRDLTSLGCSVLPTKTLQNDYLHCKSEVETYLHKSDLIIHLIPGLYTGYFENQRISLSEFQYNISSHFLSEQKEIKRLIWLPEDLEIADEENQIFIEKLQREPDKFSNTTILKCNLEDFKKYYRTQLADEQNENLVEEQVPDIYVISDHNGDEIEKHIFNMLNNKEICVKSERKGISYYKHLKFLSASKIVVLCYSGGNQPWFQVKMHDIIKAPGFDHATSFEKKILISKSDDLNSELLNDVFTHVVKDLKDLESAVKI